RGALPYRDVWDLKPPAVYWTYALILGALGKSPLAIHLADLLAASVVGAGLFTLARRPYGAGSALAAAAWYGALYFRGGFWGLGQAESYPSVALVLAALAAAKPSDPDPRPQLSWWFAAGLAAGVAVLYKFTLLLPTLAILSWAFARAITIQSVMSSAALRRESNTFRVFAP